MDSEQLDREVVIATASDDCFDLVMRTAAKLCNTGGNIGGEILASLVERMALAMNTETGKVLDKIEETLEKRHKESRALPGLKGQ